MKEAEEYREMQHSISNIKISSSNTADETEKTQHSFNSNEING